MWVLVTPFIHSDQTWILKFFPPREYAIIYKIDSVITAIEEGKLFKIIKVQSHFANSPNTSIVTDKPKDNFVNV
ncbi:hypothetical protein ABK040_001597 [Willaertia magna]